MGVYLNVHARVNNVSANPGLKIPQVVPRQLFPRFVFCFAHPREPKQYGTPCKLESYIVANKLRAAPLGTLCVH